MPERALVRELGACPGRHRNLATGIQRGAAEEGAGWSHTSRLRKTTGNEISYSDHRTLNGTATQKGVTSVLSGKNEKNQTLLEWAISHGDANIVRMLIDKGVDTSNVRVAHCYMQLHDRDVPAGTIFVSIKLGDLLPEGSELIDGFKINGSCRLNEEIISESVSRTSKKLFSEKKIRGNIHLFRITVDCDRTRLKSISDKLSVDEIRIVEYEYTFEVNARQKAKARINANEMEKSVRQCIIEQYYKDVTFDSRPGSEENIFVKVKFPAVLAKGMPPKIPARAN